MTNINWSAVWQTLSDLVNSNGFTATAGAFFAAWAGTAGAQAIAERTRGRLELVQELSRTNNAVVLSASVADWVLSVKEQNIDPMVSEFEQFADAFSKGTGGSFEPNLMLLRVGSPPIEALRTHVLERIFPGALAVRLASSAARSVQDLNALIETRNQLVEEFRTRKLDGIDFINAYFGRPNSAGHRDARYATTLKGMQMLCDSAAFFCVELSEALSARGAELHQEFSRRYRFSKRPRRSVVSYKDSRDKGLVPSAELEPYKSLMALVRPANPPPDPWWRRW